MHRRSTLLQEFLPEYERGARARLDRISKAIRESSATIPTLIHDLRNLACEATLMGDERMANVAGELEAMLVSTTPRGAILAAIDAAIIPHPGGAIES